MLRWLCGDADHTTADNTAYHRIRPAGPMQYVRAAALFCEEGPVGPPLRLLLRMNNGIGFLLRITDVEKQPFRSMGFVSVIITSVIFALGLPLVLL